jgi:hypothetical protein
MLFYPNQELKFIRGLLNATNVQKPKDTLIKNSLIT